MCTDEDAFTENELVRRLLGMSKTQPLITIFTPSHAYAADTNAQQLTAKELVAGYSDRFRLAMFLRRDQIPESLDVANYPWSSGDS